MATTTWASGSPLLPTCPLSTTLLCPVSLNRPHPGGGRESDSGRVYNHTYNNSGIQAERCTSEKAQDARRPQHEHCRRHQGGLPGGQGSHHEMFLGEEYIGREMDMWSLGVVLYTMTAGSLPLDGDNWEKLKSNITHGRIENIFEEVPDH
nr:maternal embryonic leucine zipper kinase-like [Microcebus murinus]